MADICKSSIIDNYGTVLMKSTVLMPYKVEKRLSAGKGPVGLYVLSPKGSHSTSAKVKSILKIYPEFSDWETDPGTRNIFSLCMLSRSTSGTFLRSGPYGLLVEGSKIEPKTPKYPYMFSEFLVGDNLMEIDLLKWTWVEMVGFIFKVVLGLRESENILHEFVHGNLHPGNIFVTDTPSFETKIYNLKVSETRTIKVYPPSIRIMDFEMSTNITFDKPVPHYKEPEAFGFPLRLVQMVAKYIGMSNTAKLAKLVNNFYEKNKLYRNDDMRVLNMYIGLFQLIRAWTPPRSTKDKNTTPPKLFFRQQIKYINTTMFVTSSWLNELASNPMFDVISTPEIPNTELTLNTGEIRFEHRRDNTEVHKQVVAKFCTLLPFFGLFLSAPIVKFLMQDIAQLEEEFYKEFNRLTKLEIDVLRREADEFETSTCSKERNVILRRDKNNVVRTRVFEWYFRLIMPTVQGKHILDGDNISVSASVIGDRGELLVSIDEDHIRLHPVPKYNLQMIYPRDSLLDSNVTGIQEFIAELPPGKNVTFNIESLSYNVRTFQYDIEVSMLTSEKGNQRSFYFKRRNALETKFANIMQVLIPNPAELLDLFVKTGVIKNMARWSVGTTSAPHLNVDRWTLEKDKEYMDFTDFLFSNQVGGLEDNQFSILQG